MGPLESKSGHSQLGFHLTCKTKTSFGHQSAFAESTERASVAANTVHVSYQGLAGLTSVSHECHLITYRRLRRRTDARRWLADGAAGCQ